MNAGKERAVAYAIGIILVVVGVVCYAAFPDRMPEQPVRIMFRSTEIYTGKSIDGCSRR